MSAVKSDYAHVLHGEKIPDPFHAFSDPAAPVTRAYIAGQEEKYNSVIAQTSPDAVAGQYLSALATVTDKGIPAEAAGKYLFYYRGAGDKTARLMVADTPAGQGRVLVDPQQGGAPSTDEIKGAYIQPGGNLLAYRIGNSGVWESPVRFRNIETGEDIEDVIPKAGTLWWDKDGKGFHYNCLSDDGARRVMVKHHTLGDYPDRDPVIYNNPENRHLAGSFSHGSYLGHFRYEGDEEWFFVGAHDMKSDVYLKGKDDSAFRKLVEGDGYHVPVAKTPEGILFYTTADAPNGKLVLVDPANPQRENWQTVIPEDKQDNLQHVFYQHGKLFGVYMHDCADEIRVFGADGTPEGNVPLPPQVSVLLSHSNFGGISLGSGPAAATSSELMLRVSSFTNPDCNYKYDIDTKQCAPVDTPAAGIEGCIVERIYATSKDGTKVPMTVIRGKDTKLDGTAALRLDAYGAHGAKSRPHFSGEVADFVRSGGIYVQANIRGGGEFGEAWHEAGKGLNKQNSFDDYISCARHLAAQKYTSSSRIVATGHSSGGLLVLASMVQAPDAFGAVIAGSPVADMVRENPPWLKEYGDAFASKQELDYMKGYCPRLNIREGVTYPPCLVRTGMLDKDLLPDACKFVATMQDTSPQSTILLHVEADYGHVPARPKDVELRETLAKKSFIEQMIGPIDQAAFSKELDAGLRTLGTAAKVPPKPVAALNF